MISETVNAPRGMADDRDNFMAGVALFDEAINEMRKAQTPAPGEFWGTWQLHAYWRREIDEAPAVAPPLNVVLRPTVAKLLARPELLDGFAAALGDYIGEIQQGAAIDCDKDYEGLTYDDIHGPGVDREEVSRG